MRQQSVQPALLAQLQRLCIKLSQQVQKMIRKLLKLIRQDMISQKNPHRELPLDFETNIQKIEQQLWRHKSLLVASEF